jgi:hypothetical protein
MIYGISIAGVFDKKTGRPRIYATDAEGKRAYRQRKGIRERGIYGQRFSRHKPQLT